MPTPRWYRHPFLVEAGQRARHRRSELGLTIEAVAHRSGLDPTYVGAVERGERSAGLFYLGKLASGLDLDLGTLLDGLPDPERHDINGL